MRTIAWNVETSQQRADWSGEIEVEDNATDEEIKAQVRDEVFNFVLWGWTDVTQDRAAQPGAQP